MGTDQESDSCTSDLDKAVFDDLTDANDKIQSLLDSGLQVSEVDEVLSILSDSLSDAYSLVSSVTCLSSSDASDLLNDLYNVLSSFSAYLSDTDSQLVFEQCPTCLTELNSVNELISALIQNVDSKLKTNPCASDCDEVARLNGVINIVDSELGSLNSANGSSLAIIESFTACESTPSSCSQSTWTTVISVPCAETGLAGTTLYATGKANAAVERLQLTNGLRARAAPTAPVSSSVNNGTANSSVVAQYDSASAMKPMGILVAAGLAIAMLA